MKYVAIEITIYNRIVSLCFNVTAFTRSHSLSTYGILQNLPSNFVDGTILSHNVNAHQNVLFLSWSRYKATLNCIWLWPNYILRENLLCSDGNSISRIFCLSIACSCPKDRSTSLENSILECNWLRQTSYCFKVPC